MRKGVTIVVFIAVTAGIMFGLYQAVRAGVISEPKTPNNTPVVFSNQRMLLELWGDYKENILEPKTLRALDKQQDNITTSEGQSYTMMRAVWMDDKEVFNQTWQWTKDNMQRDDKLISWRFGERPDGSYGIQDAVGGQNTATDADVDIAYALIMASNRWKEGAYLYDAEAMLKSIWQKQVVSVNGEPVLTANDIERLNQESVLVNPSYFSPYAYRVFAEVDPENNWNALVDSSYSLLFAASDSALDTGTSSGLTPNWVRLNRETGELSADSESDTNYGYDAFRTPWRLTLDYRYNNEPRAQQLLEKYGSLKDSWEERRRLASVYRHDGVIAVDDTVPASHGASLGYFIVEEPELAREVYEQQLLIHYSPDNQGWTRELSYYDDNWAWFGMALYLEELPDIAGQ